MKFEKDDSLEISEELTSEEIKYFEDLLLSEKQKILDKVKNAAENENIKSNRNEIRDDVDAASNNIAQNVLFSLLDRERKLLNEIERSLKKIKSGEYGYCEGTGDPIPKKRLKLNPWTRYSVQYKEMLEKQKKMISV